VPEIVSIYSERVYGNILAVILCTVISVGLWRQPDETSGTSTSVPSFTAPADSRSDVVLVSHSDVNLHSVASPQSPQEPIDSNLAVSNFV